MTRIRPTLATVLFTLALSGCAHSKAKPADSLAPATLPAGHRDSIPFVGTLEVERYVFDNGLRLLVVEDHSSATFAYQTWFRVGSRDELPGYTGLAHFFEHMMFKGTTSHPDGELDRLLESAGAEGQNAFTSPDHTVYVQELPSTEVGGNKLDLIASLEADRMRNLIVDENGFKTEREVVHNERRFRTENSPDGTMYQELFGTMFSKHPYHWPVIGYEADLNRMTAKDARDFYKTWYSPNHATVVVVGDVKFSEVKATVAKYYGAIPASDNPVRVIEEEPAQTSPRRQTLRLNLQSDKLMIGYHVPAVVHEDTPALNVLNSVITAGKSSRLQRALVETGIANSVGSDAADNKDPSLFLISVALQKDKRASQAESVILKELDRLSRKPVSAAELERAKNQMSFQFYDGLGGNMDKANFLGQFEAATGNFENGMLIHQKSQAVTIEQVQAAARKYFDPKGRTVIVGTPKTGGAP